MAKVKRSLKLWYNGMILPKSYLVSKMKEYGIRSISVSEAIREVDTDYFFCTASEEVGTKKESVCGKLCKDYRPRNKKNGCCKYRRFCYAQGKEMILDYSGKLSDDENCIYQFIKQNGENKSSF